MQRRSEPAPGRDAGAIRGAARGTLVAGGTAMSDTGTRELDGGRFGCRHDAVMGGSV